MAAHGALAHVYTEKAEPAMALREADEEMSLLKEYGDRRRQATALLILAYLNIETGIADGAADAADQAKALFEELDDVKGQGIALYMSIFANLAKDDQNTAITVGEAAKELFVKVGDKKWEAETQLAIGIAYSLDQDFEQGLAVAKEGLGIL